MSYYQETKAEALLHTVAGWWLLIGLLLPAPLVPLMLARQMSWIAAIFLCFLATALWLGVPFLLRRHAHAIREKRIREEK